MRPVRLLYANRDRDSVIFHDQLQQLGASHPDRFDLRHHLDDDAGFLDADAIGAFVAADLDADFYICGPGPFMDLVEAGLARQRDRPGTDLDRALPQRRPARIPVDDATASPDEEVPETVTLILKGKRHAITYKPGDTVLETARRGGLQAPFSCEAGNCATCMALVHEGSATMRVNNALTPDEVAEGWVLTCQSLPRGQTVTIEYESF